MVDPSKSKSIDSRYYNDPEIQSNFFSKVEQEPLYNERLRKKLKSDCWIYKGCKNSNGYAIFSVKDIDRQPVDVVSKKTGKKYRKYPYKTFYSHRLSWAIFSGDGDSLKNMTYEHICGVKDCVNPEHAVLMTIAENNYAKFERNVADFEYDLQKFKTNVIDTSKFIFYGTHGEESLFPKT